VTQYTTLCICNEILPLHNAPTIICPRCKRTYTCIDGKIFHNEPRTPQKTVTFTCCKVPLKLEIIPNKIICTVCRTVYVVLENAILGHVLIKEVAEGHDL
jgi:hypothetical protein